jgi:hypothetical protein
MNRILVSQDERVTWVPQEGIEPMSNSALQIFIAEAMRFSVACNVEGPNPDAVVLLSVLTDGTRMFMTWEPA